MDRVKVCAKHILKEYSYRIIPAPDRREKEKKEKDIEEERKKKVIDRIFVYFLNLPRLEDWLIGKVRKS